MRRRLARILRGGRACLLVDRSRAAGGRGGVFSTSAGWKHRSPIANAFAATVVDLSTAGRSGGKGRRRGRWRWCGRWSCRSIEVYRAIGSRATSLTGYTLSHRSCQLLPRAIRRHARGKAVRSPIDDQVEPSSRTRACSGSSGDGIGQMLKSIATAFDEHDLDGIMVTSPRRRLRRATDRAMGIRFVGTEAVRAGFAARSPDPDIRSARRAFVDGDRGASEWTLSGTTTEGQWIEVRGCDLWTFRDGRDREEGLLLEDQDERLALAAATLVGMNLDPAATAATVIEVWNGAPVERLREVLASDYRGHMLHLKDGDRDAAAYPGLIDAIPSRESRNGISDRRSNGGWHSPGEPTRGAPSRRVDRCGVGRARDQHLALRHPGSTGRGVGDLVQLDGRVVVDPSDGYAFREPTERDFEAVVAVLLAEQRADDVEPTIDAHFLRQVWSRPGFDLAADAWVGIDARRHGRRVWADRPGRWRRRRVVGSGSS